MYKQFEMGHLLLLTLTSSSGHLRWSQHLHLRLLRGDVLYLVPCLTHNRLSKKWKQLEQPKVNRLRTSKYVFPLLREVVKIIQLIFQVHVEWFLLIVQTCLTAPYFTNFLKHGSLLRITRHLQLKSVFFPSVPLWFLIETNSKDNSFLFFSDFNYFCHPQCCLKINETNMNKTLDK